MKNKLSWALIVMALVLLAFMASCSGLRSDNLAKVDRPGIVNAVLSNGEVTEPTTETLNEARFNFRRFKSEVEIGAEQYAVEIEWAERVAALIDSSFGQGLNLAIPFFGEFPGGSVLLAALTGVAGLMRRRPGDAKAITERDARIEELRAAVAENTKAREGGE